MNTNTALRRLALCVALTAPSGAALAQAGVDRQAAFERAMADYERQHFSAAYQALWVLADQGHVEAARITLLMAAHGQRLYGMRFAIGPVQRERWLAAALPHGDGTVTAMAR